ncbi:MAG: response regulator transcription factor [Chitinophagaceae bacterium]|nr:response regulator transcription factor [Chitinophagaceae bacterium]
MPLRISIFDDNKNIRDSISMLLSTTDDIEVVGSYPDVSNVIQNVRMSKPDIVLMDIEMPGKTGIEAVKEIKKEYPQVLVMMQTVFEDDDRVFQSICAGASGYILKNYLNSRLVDSIRELQYGGSPMSPSIARKVLTLMQNSPVQLVSNKDDYRLSPREKDVLSLLVKGLSYKMIASDLHISYETVRSHMKKIYEKLHVASLTEAVAKAINQRIV